MSADGSGLVMRFVAGLRRLPNAVLAGFAFNAVVLAGLVVFYVGLRYGLLAGMIAGGAVLGAIIGGLRRLDGYRWY